MSADSGKRYGRRRCIAKGAAALGVEKYDDESDNGSLSRMERHPLFVLSACLCGAPLARGSAEDDGAVQGAVAAE